MKLLYFFDPLCGWCYGFGGVLDSLLEKHKEIELEVICGGMITGDLQGPIGERGKYISDAIPRLVEMTGATIGENYKKQMADGSFYCSSVKPSVILQWIKSNMPEKAYKAASLIQKKMFIEGENPEQDSFYLSICENLEIPYSEVIGASVSDEWLFKTKSEFRYCADLGITGYPALVAEKDNQLYLVSRGYSNLETVEEVLGKIYPEISL